MSAFTAALPCVNESEYPEPVGVTLARGIGVNANRLRLLPDISVAPGLLETALPDSEKFHMAMAIAPNA